MIYPENLRDQWKMMGDSKLGAGEKTVTTEEATFSVETNNNQ